MLNKISTWNIAKPKLTNIIYLFVLFSFSSPDCAQWKETGSRRTGCLNSHSSSSWKLLNNPRWTKIHQKQFSDPSRDGLHLWMKLPLWVCTTSCFSRLGFWSEKGAIYSSYCVFYFIPQVLRVRAEGLQITPVKSRGDIFL